MTSIATSGATETMAYDAFGRRVQKAVPSGPTYNYIYDASGRLATVYSTTVGWYKDNVFAGSGSAIIASENASGGACTTCYYTTDHLGSTRMLTDQYGDAATRHDYMPFGVEIPANTYSRGSTFGSTTDVIEKFTGQIRDQEAGQDYFNARFFTAAIGRLSSPDPVNAGASLFSSQSWNGYAYVLGNPITSTDPSGMDAIGIPVVPCNGCTTTVTGDPGAINTWDWADQAWMEICPTCPTFYATAYAATGTTHGGGGALGGQAPPAKSGTAQACLPSVVLASDTSGGLQNVYNLTRLLSRVTGRSIGLGVGGGFGFGMGMKRGLGFQSSVSAGVVTDLNGDSALQFSIQDQVPALMPMYRDSGLGGAANIGYQLSVTNQSLHDTESGLSFAFSGSYGPLAVDANAHGVTVTEGVGVGARYGFGPSFSATGLLRLCNE